MPVKVYGFDESSAQRVVKAVRRVEELPRDEPGLRQATPPPRRDQPLLQWVKCTDGTADADGRYAAEIRSYDEGANSWTAGAPCYLRADPHGTAPTANKVYLARVAGVHPSDGRAVFVPDLSGGSGTTAGATIDVEEVDGSPSLTGITKLQFDQGDNFVVSQPSAGVARIDLTALAGTITVEEADGSPSYAGVTTLRFDQADLFVVSQPGAGIARIDLNGHSGTVTLVSNVTCSAGTMTVYKRDLTYTSGLLSNVGAEYV